MLRSLTWLLGFQLAGEITSFGLKLPVPGPVIGMAALFVVLLVREEETRRLEATAQELLRHLSLLFVPAGVGVMLYMDLVRREWLPIVASVVASTALALVVSAATMRAVARWLKVAEEGDASAADRPPAQGSSS